MPSLYQSLSPLLLWPPPGARLAGKAIEGLSRPPLPPPPSMLGLGLALDGVVDAEEGRRSLSLMESAGYAEAMGIIAKRAHALCHRVATNS